MSTETSDKNVVSEEEKLMKSLEYELDRIIEKSSKVETAAEIAYLRQPIILMFLKLLKEREQDKKKIKELEEHQKKFYNGELYTAKQLKQIEENQNKYFINKQKVKDVLQKNRNELFSTTYVDDIQYKPYTMQIDRINKIERELLEGE